MIGGFIFVAEPVELGAAGGRKAFAVSTRRHNIG
jgi:hypothetical protein